MACATTLLHIGAAEIKHTVVKTSAPNNQEVKVYYRIPAGYSPTRKEAYRVLVYFGGRNEDPGSRHVKGVNGWAEWADEQQIFIVCPYFRDDYYWEPGSWSGQALATGIANIKKGYNICTSKMLYYGYSAGGRAANLFAAWRPDTTRAWAAHASDFFHNPTAMRGIPGLVTCGDADPFAYWASRNFLEQCRLSKVDIIFKSHYNLGHRVSDDSRELARAFLAFYHQLNKNDLNSRNPARYTSAKAQFIGDDLEGVFYPANSPGAKNIPREDSIPLPNEEIARIWGTVPQ